MKIDPTKVIEEIIGRGIEFFDYRKMDKGLHKQYKADAEMILKSEVFTNELNHYIADLVKFCATLQGTPLNSDRLITLTNVQFGIVVLETLRDRLKAIEEPTNPDEVENPFEGI